MRERFRIRYTALMERKSFEKSVSTGKEGERIEKLKNLILTNEEYRDHPFAREEDARAYVFKLEHKGKCLFYFGSAHITCPADSLYTEIKARFDEVMPDMVYIEGAGQVNHDKDAVREGVLKTTLGQARANGEGNFVLKLGVDVGADFESPEPELSQEINRLRDKGFSRQDIFSFYMYRDIDQYQRQHKVWTVPGCKKYLEPYIKNFHRASGWSAEEMAILGHRIFSELKISDNAFYHTRVNPIPWDGEPQTATNEISRVSSSFRDRYIFERIAEGLKTHDRLFVVYGSAHAVKQEPALRALMSGLPAS